jgi:RNA polymerase sigma-70 factor (ECF subfamily)
VSLDELAEVPSHDNPADSASNQQALERVRGLIQRLKPPDALVMSLYLEDIGASEIGEIIGLSATAVATRIHRIKTVLAGEFHKGGSDDGHT